MRALLTGGNGFVGRHLADHLRREGDEVTILDLPDDITDGGVVEKVLREVRPDAIYHLAALSHVGSSWSDPSTVLRVNVIGSAVVFAVAREVVPEATTLFVSSAEVYGAVQPDRLPLDEDCTPEPISPYAASKLAGEILAQQAVRAFGQRIVIARPFNHVGPGQSPQFFVPAMASRMVDAVRDGRREIPVGNLTTRRDFLDVRDVVSAYRLLVEHGVAGEVYNIASGVDRSMSDIAYEIRSLVDDSLTLVEDETLMRPVDVPVLRGNAKKINAATGWSPRWSWSDTLADVIASVR